MKKKISEFTFCVLCYNHEDYISEHLNSIVFIIQKYGKTVDCDLIISDDYSKDRSRLVIESWLLSNSKYFRSISLLFSGHNQGTCRSTVNVIKQIKTEHCKITASDDVYTDINIFKFICDFSSQTLTNSVPVRLINGKIKISKLEVFLFLASDLIYRKYSLVKQLSSFSVISAPNLFYPVKKIKDERVLEFLAKYQVVEDLALQIALSEYYPDIKLTYNYTPIVLYRRTGGSTYKTFPDKLVDDNINLLDYFKNMKSPHLSFYERLLIGAKRNFWLSVRCNKISRIFFRFARLDFLLRLIINLPSIIVAFRSVRIDLPKLKAHYEEISRRST